VCGACTVRIAGRSQRACLTFAVQVDGSNIETVEGLAGLEGDLTDLQLAFRKHHALQCGYCTPGILMSTEDYLGRHPDPTEEEVRDMLSGHLCRCTGYVGMVRAILDTARLRGAKQVAG
jgi:2-furoyl-CoA dehydrogenase 2Fe-2S iron sulfur subunit